MKPAVKYIYKCWPTTSSTENFHRTVLRLCTCCTCSRLTAYYNACCTRTPENTNKCLRRKVDKISNSWPYHFWLFLGSFWPDFPHTLTEGHFCPAQVSDLCRSYKSQNLSEFPPQTLKKSYFFPWPNS